MNKVGIKVHAAFNTCRSDATKGLFPPHYEGSYLVDVHNPEFQVFISDLMGECAAISGIDGICLDYIRADYKDADGTLISETDGERNDESIATIVRMTYEKVKAVNPECVVSSTTAPYYDIAHPKMVRSGRKAIDWANNGYHDILFEMNSGKYWTLEQPSHVVGATGDPPHLEEFTYKGRELLNDPEKLIVMVSSYENTREGAVVPTDSVKWQAVLDAVKDEEELAIYTAWLFTDEHAALTAARAVPEPAPEPEPEPEPVPPTSPLFFQRKNFF